MPRRRAGLAALTTAVALLIGACSGADDATTATDREPEVDEAVTAVVYKTPTCDCCARHAAHLEASGFEVEFVTVDDIRPVKDAEGVPPEVESCHTTVVDGYAVEGHVPAASIERLLAERPDSDGIGLAGMPAGSPGMGGSKDEPWDIQAFTGGEITGTFETR